MYLVKCLLKCLPFLGLCSSQNIRSICIISIRIFAWHMFCKYSFPVCCLSFYFLNGVFWGVKDLNCFKKNTSLFCFLNNCSKNIQHKICHIFKFTFILLDNQSLALFSSCKTKTIYSLNISFLFSTPTYSGNHHSCFLALWMCWLEYFI